uniref:hypothetical protein n=1 Tax=Thaumasiovibrio occultus TaxID=1891184 RepID=UPI000B353DA3|nr:hypothetical protein [Thaumasiovibrio occultus]
MKYWKEQYTTGKALAAGIHGNEGVPITGFVDGSWRPYVAREPIPWLYYVEVCNFQFVFFSLDMLDLYIDYFSRKILPTSRFYGVSPFSNGPAASIGDGQSPFERLPAFLRKKNNRRRVLKALEQAKAHFVNGGS